ncbi:MAG: hypothetical protein K1000chlam1_00843, partial [Candidatus Anoxychlamydiales bacterium]|nr:hypothetical protein [Candidatus Anoxychlamydiales bacterium]
QTKKQKKCQVDLIIQTKFNNLFICEIKFERGPIKKTVIKEVQEKVKRLKIPKGFSLRTVLMHVNGVEDTIIDSDYFSKIIDFGQFLES